MLFRKRDAMLSLKLSCGKNLKSSLKDDQLMDRLEVDSCSKYNCRKHNFLKAYFQRVANYQIIIFIINHQDILEMFIDREVNTKK